MLGDGTSTPVTPGSPGGGTKQSWPWDGDSTALVSAQPGATLQPWEAMGVGSNEAKGRHRGEAVSDAPQNAMGSSVPTRQDCLVPLLMPPRLLMALAHPCTGGDAGPPWEPTLVQRSKARQRDEGHSPGDAPVPLGLGTEGCPKPGCPVPCRANVPREPTCAEEAWSAANTSMPGASGGG